MSSADVRLHSGTGQQQRDSEQGEKFIPIQPASTGVYVSSSLTCIPLFVWWLVLQVIVAFPSQQLCHPKYNI